ncbi:hypothetical protein E2C01_094841 [Portunus trituberculatus]|uniref:Uncharacterized protein n=1 Tax=Portunus trituberculatus TaxID=210409 RepID=A0A5B7K2R6_PORTR|nr:hypothetical protein [Portunus trituberculatus]
MAHCAMQEMHGEYKSRAIVVLSDRPSVLSLRLFWSRGHALLLVRQKR